MALQVGSRLGHYDVTALIGEGGMGCNQAPLSVRMPGAPSVQPFLAKMGAELTTTNRRGAVYG